MDDRNIPYNKERLIKPHKQFGGGGPRDMQRKQNIGSTTLNMPHVDETILKEELERSTRMTRDELKAELLKEMENLKEVVTTTRSIEGIGLPFDIVEQKIKEAVEQTEKLALERYESGLGSLNSQLNASKARVKELDALLIEKRQEVADLKRLIEEKDILINTLREQQNKEVGELKTQILNLIDNIKSGHMNRDSYSDPDRPIIDDRVFIDPLTEVVTDLESHIDVSAAEAKGNRIDLKGDVAKLKDLLGKGKYKPVKAG